jgi:plasmid maintenance system antidote protein VapI
MPRWRFGSVLEEEFAARRVRNGRYSLRAFAAYLEADHSTISQVIRGQRRAPAAQISKWATRLGLCAEEAEIWVAAECDAPGAWAAEGLRILRERAHWRIVELARQSHLRADSRWVAEQIGQPVDTVNAALSRLLRLGLLEMHGTEWREATGLDELTENEFRCVALRRLKEAHGVWEIR